MSALIIEQTSLFKNKVMSLKTKIVLILLAALTICLIALYGLFKLYQNEKSERKRYNNNMIALIEDRSRQQEITVNELKKLYPKYDSLAKELNIKTKFITNIIDTRYRFRDSVLTSTILKKDSISEKSYFMLNEKCYSLSGYIKKDSISFTNKEFKDNLTTFLYKDWDKKYLWGLLKFKPHYTAKVYSECLNDTIGITNNIKLKK
jgi:hypothetical protein